MYTHTHTEGTSTTYYTKTKTSLFACMHAHVSAFVRVSIVEYIIKKTHCAVDLFFIEQVTK